MKILIVNTCSNKLNEREFVLPFENNNTRTNHYSKLKDLDWADKILITGRTKHFINAFGEELVIENTDLALSRTCKKLSVSFYNYSAAPIFITGTKRGAHEWIIEFIEDPKNKEKFINLLDGELRKINSDYDAKRYKDIAIKQPKIHFVKTGFFDYWLKSKGKLGGQNKIPRLSNDRKYLDSMLEHVSLFQ